MFYSQTFLARKGPLGTVWCAAHLQPRLKKSHYTSTNIPSTVDRIMFPEVPIALRMSGHLLLGVVRIYSKKVDYLYHDCNVVLIGLRKAFSSVDVNLPEDATHAPAHTITLPDKFNLDSLVLDDFIYDYDDDFDHNLRSRDEITLTEQVPVERDIYVAITFDEDFTTDFMRREDVPGSGGNRMEEDPLHVPPQDVDMVFQDTDELFNATMGSQDPGASGQKELPSETVDMQDPGASNHTEILTGTVDVQEPGASNQTEVLGGTMEEPGPSSETEVLNARLTDNTAPESFPETEIMRDAIHDFSTENLPPFFSDHGKDSTEPTGLPDQTLNEKELQTPILDVALDSGGQSFQILQHSKQPASAVSEEVPEHFDTNISLGHSSPALAIRSTPPVQPQQQKRRARKRNLLDKAIVLPNKVMKKALVDTSDLLRKKRNLPSSALGVWKLNNSVRKEQVFDDPLMTGLSSDICQIFKKDFISAKPHLVAVEEDFPEPMVTDSVDHEIEAIPEPSVAVSPVPAAEAFPDPGVVQSPSHTTETIPEPRIAESPNHTHEGIQGPEFASSSIPMPEIDIEIERLRHEESNVGNDSLPEFMGSPLRRDDLTPSTNNSLGSGSVPQGGTTIGSSVLPTADSASAGTYGSDFETPRTFLEEQLGLDHTGLSDIPELNSAEDEDLSFLEADNNTPTGSQASQGVDTLSVRTRAVAQYLKRHSPITPVSEDPSGDLSLNKILAGKTRKICARMFFETLVLKTYDLIDVQQEEPYGDITLKLTPNLSKVQI